MPWRPFGTPDGRFLATLEAVLGHAEAVLAPPLHEKMHVLVCTLLESFRPAPPRGRKFCQSELVLVLQRHILDRKTPLESINESPDKKLGP